MSRRFALIIPVVGALALAGCQPEPTPEQKAAAALQQMAQQMGAALGGAEGSDAQNIDPQALGQAMAQIGAMAGAMDPNMSPEDRAKLNAITGAMASGQVHPAASAYVAGLDKVYTLLATIKDDAGVEAARPKLAALYAEMAPSAAALKAMSQDERDVAMGSAYAQILGFSMKISSLMMPLMSNPELGEKVSGLLEGLPAAE